MYFTDDPSLIFTALGFTPESTEGKATRIMNRVCEPEQPLVDFQELLKRQAELGIVVEPKAKISPNTLN
jgi:hypothetical protein